MDSPCQPSNLPLDKKGKGGGEDCLAGTNTKGHAEGKALLLTEQPDYIQCHHVLFRLEEAAVNQDMDGGPFLKGVVFHLLHQLHQGNRKAVDIEGKNQEQMIVIFYFPACFLVFAGSNAVFIHILPPKVGKYLSVPFGIGTWRPGTSIDYHHRSHLSTSFRIVSSSCS